MMNTRVLPGGLRKGDNTLNIKSDLPGKARLTLAWREDAPRSLELSPVLNWGVKPGEEKQMVLLKPNQPLMLHVKGLDSSAKLLCTGNLSAQYQNGTITLSTSDSSQRLAGLVIQSGDIRREIVVAVLPEFRWVPVSKISFPDGDAQLLPPDETRSCPVVRTSREGGSITYQFDAIPKGKYMVFSLVRNPLKETRNVLARLAGKPSTRPYTLIRKTNNSAEFYKAEKNIWRFRWDYPIDGRYPYEIMSPLAFDDINNITLNIIAPEIEIAGALILPANDMQFLSDFRKYLCGFNYQPLRF